MKSQLFAISLSLLSFTAIAQNATISEIAQKLNDYYQFYPQENIHLSTDKEIYKPEEIIWFSLYLTDGTGKPTQSISNECQVSLYSSSGMRVTGDVFQLKEGFTNGDLLIPKGLEQGKYVLVANTGPQTQANEAFYKLIYLNPKDEEAIRVRQKGMLPLLEPGKLNFCSFSIENMNGEPLKKDKLEYQLYAQEELIQKDKVKTDEAGLLKLAINLPNRLYDGPLKFLLNEKKGRIAYSCLLPVQTEKIELNFLPEGGKTIAGVSQPSGFTTHNKLQQPVSVDGEIMDSNGQKFGDLKSLTPGFSMTSLKLDTTQEYTLHLTSKLGNGQTFKLPQANHGLLMSIPRTSTDFIHTSIIPSKEKEQTLFVIVNKGAEIIWVSEMQVSGPTRVKIPKADFPGGLSLISIFNQQGQALSSRLIYIEKMNKSTIFIEAPQQVKSGDIFKLTIKNPKTASKELTPINLSISSADERLDWPGQWTQLEALNAELEYPIQRLQNEENSLLSEATINYLLIANQAKNFSWQNVLHFDRQQEQNRFQQTGLFGQVLDKNNQPVPNAKVSFINSQNMQILNTSTDQNGTFFQQAIAPNDKDNFVIKAIGSDGNSDLRVVFEKSMAEQISDHVQRVAQQVGGNEEAQFSQSFFRQNKQLFSKLKQQKQTQREEPYLKFLETATSLMDVIKMIKPYRLEGDRIIFPGGTNSLNAQDGALIVIDGQKVGTSSSILQAINPNDVASVNVSTSPVDIQRHTGLNSVGVIEIETKRGTIDQETTTPTEPEEQLYQNGQRIPRDFWQRKAKFPETQPTTLFWSPGVHLSQLGHAEFEVATNHVIGKFLIRAELVNADGNLIRIEKPIEIIP